MPIRAAIPKHFSQISVWIILPSHTSRVCADYLRIDVSARPKISMGVRPPRPRFTAGEQFRPTTLYDLPGTVGGHLAQRRTDTGLQFLPHTSAGAALPNFAKACYAWNYEHDEHISAGIPQGFRRRAGQPGRLWHKQRVRARAHSKRSGSSAVARSAARRCQIRTDKTS